MVNGAQLVGPIFAGVGGLLLLIGILWTLSAKGFKSKAQKTTGVVTALVPRMSSGSSGRHTVTYAPAVRFQTSSGQQVDFVSKVSSNHPSVQVGSPVEVLYLADNPQKAKMNRFTSLWLGPLIFLLIGVTFTGVGVGVWFAV